MSTKIVYKTIPFTKQNIEVIAPVMGWSVSEVDEYYETESYGIDIGYIFVTESHVDYLPTPLINVDFVSKFELYKRCVFLTEELPNEFVEVVFKKHNVTYQRK